MFILNICLNFLTCFLSYSVKLFCPTVFFLIYTYRKCSGFLCLQHNASFMLNCWLQPCEWRSVHSYLSLQAMEKTIGCREFVSSDQTFHSYVWQHRFLHCFMYRYLYMWRGDYGCKELIYFLESSWYLLLVLGCWMLQCSFLFSQDSIHICMYWAEARFFFL